MKRNLSIVFIILICLLSSLFVVTASDNDNSSDNIKLNVTTDISQALDDSKTLNKPVLMIFDQDNCVYCQMLKMNTLSNETIVNQLNDRFVVVMVNINEKSEVASNYGVYGTPEMIIVDGDASEIHRIEGYVSSDELLNEIKGI